MARNVGPSRLEADIGKWVQKNTGKVILLGAGVALAVALLSSADYFSSYSGVIEEVRVQKFNYRGRKNRGLKSVDELCLVMRVDGEEEPRVDCTLPPDLVRSYVKGQRFEKPRFRSRPIPVGPPPEATPPAEPEAPPHEGPHAVSTVPPGTPH